MGSNIDYSFFGRDFTARFEALLTRLRQEVPELTDMNHSDAGVSILRLLAHESDILGFYIDEAFNEGFIETAKFKQSLIDIAKTVDVLPKLASAAKTTVTVTRKDGVQGDIIIPKYTAFSRFDGLTYLTDSDAVLYNNITSIDINVTQGKLITLTLQPNDFVISLLTKRPQYNLGRNVAAGSVMVSHGSPSILWTEVDSFWRSTSDDYHFLLELYAEPINDETDTVFLTLGDGIHGKSVPNSAITVRFIRTDGAKGNAGSGTISGVPSNLLDQITVINQTPATGGSYAEETESFRDRIPRVVRTQRRGLTTEDYEVLIESIPGVKHCQAIDRNYGNQWPHEYVVLFVVPEGGGPLSQGLKDLIYSQCFNWGHLGNWKERYILLDAIQVPVNINCKIGITGGYNSSVVISDVQTALNSLLSIENMDINKNLSFSVLHNTVSSVNGVSWVEFYSPTIDIIAGIGKILVPGVYTINTA